MPRVPFEDLPDHGRLWVFPASRALSQDEATRCLREVDDFLAEWAAHGAPLRAGRPVCDSNDHFRRGAVGKTPLWQDGSPTHSHTR